MKSFIILSGLLLVSFEGVAGILSKAECTPTDIRNTHPLIKTRPELRQHFSVPKNQDSIGWCYAFSASDIMSAYLGKPISSLHTSIINNYASYSNGALKRVAEKYMKTEKTPYKEVYETGNVEDSIRHASKKGWICTEKGLPFDAPRPNQINDMIRRLEALKLKNKETKSSLQNVCEDIMRTIEPFKVVATELENLAMNLVSTNMNETLNKFADSACTEKIQNLPKMDLEVKTKVDGKGKPNNDYLQHLNKLLTNGHVTQVAYMVDSITTISGPHSSIVMGRRWNNDQCEFYIRNTWGKSCAVYSSDIECNKEEGAFWVSDEKLYHASSAYSYIK